MHLRALLISLLAAVLLLTHALPAWASPGAAQLPAWHTVRRGETLYAIGRLYNVHPGAIATANRLSNPNRIFPGQVLYIPAGPRYPQSGTCGSNYTVQRGDTLFGIGRAYGVSAWSIAAANRILDMNRIRAGQVLFIPCS